MDSSGARSEWVRFRVYCGKEPFRFAFVSIVRRERSVKASMPLTELKRGPLAELSLPQSLELFYSLRGYDSKLQPQLDELNVRGMDPEYVGIETQRIVDVVQGRCSVVPAMLKCRRYLLRNAFLTSLN